MNIFRAIKDLQKELDSFRKKKSSIGFVPTMGALHTGHIELIKRSESENVVTVCSLFVNPTQFNNKTDLQNYPRTETADLDLLRKNKCNIVFIPSVDEMYPTDELLKIDFGSLATIMEGAYRPGHFLGMATVVKKLFDITMPDTAYFGEKDFQQLAIIRNMVKQLDIKVSITGCATVREVDGLALSSRNIHLTKDERKNACVIYQSLVDAQNDYKNELTIEQIKNQVIKKIEHGGLFTVQYFEIVNAETLQPIDSISFSKPIQACIAVLTSKTRLIDNIALNSI